MSYIHTHGQTKRVKTRRYEQTIFARSSSILKSNLTHEHLFIHIHIRFYREVPDRHIVAFFRTTLADE